ncbi:MAG: 4'-phosphopantetheinyl transferase superfamily protein [Methylococcaceae bacterium]|nr:4'-phosphopantetheinyl transferase superfamily protein [Methylococcaceae bacterium]
MLTLPPDEIHLWFTFPNKITDKNLLLNYQQFLADEERERWQRFHFEKHQHQYLITRALVRTTLSRYADVNPKEWQFSKNKYGKPAIKNPSSELCFNLSNTETLIVCAVSKQQDMGVDVESMQHKSSTVEIAQRFFAKQEVEELLSVPKAKQRQRFFQYWTLKEAYIKAKGMGLYLPLEQFAFSINESNKSLSLSFDERLQDEAKDWQYWLLQVTDSHYAAVCIYNPKKIVYKLRGKHVIPLQDGDGFNLTLIASS